MDSHSVQPHLIRCISLFCYLAVVSLILLRPFEYLWTFFSLQSFSFYTFYFERTKQNCLSMWTGVCVFKCVPHVYVHQLFEYVSVCVMFLHSEIVVAVVDINSGFFQFDFQFVFNWCTAYSVHWTLYINLFAGNVIVAEQNRKATTEEENQTQEKECVKCFTVTVYCTLYTLSFLVPFFIIYTIKTESKQ